MDTVLVRQAILDTRYQAQGYEIRFRARPEDWFPADGEEVVESALHTFGLRRLTQGRRAFITISPAMLLRGFSSHLPPEAVVLQIPPALKPDPAIPVALQHLRGRGYSIALAGYVPDGPLEPLLSLAEWVKVDFPKVRRGLPKLRSGWKLIAEGVDSRDDLLAAFAAGYGYVQGLGYSEPELLSGRTLSPAKHGALRLLREANLPEADVDSLEALFKQDMPLSLKFLRYINSVSFGLGKSMQSLRHALVYLGLSGVRRWTSLLAVTSLAVDTPPELTVLCLVRARFCEGVATAVALPPGPVDPFLLGMCSLLPAVLGRPMRELLLDLPFSAEAKLIFNGSREGLGRLLALTEACEKADWAAVTWECSSLGLSEERMPEIYKEAIEWAEGLYREQLRS